jgi:hypothetical protein
LRTCLLLDSLPPCFPASLRQISVPQRLRGHFPTHCSP